LVLMNLFLVMYFMLVVKQAPPFCSITQTSVLLYRLTIKQLMLTVIRKLGNSLANQKRKRIGNRLLWRML
jgi:hypothetical protein